VQAKFRLPLCCAEAGERGPAQWLSRQRSGQPDVGYPECPPAGNTGGELADSRANQGFACGPGPLHAQGQARLLYCGTRGLCAVCYTLRRQDEAYFGGLREAVLARDGYACRICGASGRGKRSITVHHRVPGRSVLALMISLCPGCHAKVHRTRVGRALMAPLLLELWREQHPRGHEQPALDFGAQPSAVAVPVPLISENLPGYDGELRTTG